LPAALFDLGFERAPSLASPHDWKPPTVEQLQTALPQYEVTAFVGRGGMGAVYKGKQRSLNRLVAIKVLPPDIDDGDMQFAERFKHEAQAMARLSHPNIAAVFDAGETADGLLYFVMEFIEGTDVAQLIASEGQVDPQCAVKITSAVCDALAFAHEEGVIHRDIKPSNVMIDRKGRVKVADFGLAQTTMQGVEQLTRTSLAFNTPDFTAPEALAAGDKVDQRVDLYAVGVMLYQMLTGQIPRGRFECPSVLMPNVDKGFDAIVDKAMQVNREKRYTTAREIKTDVERVMDRSMRKRSRVPLLIGIVTCLAILGTGTVMMFDDHSAASPSVRSGEPWIDGISNPECLSLKGAEITAQGLQFTGIGGVNFVGGKAVYTRDGAVRMKASYVPTRKPPFLRARARESAGIFYRLAIGDGVRAELGRWDRAENRQIKLGAFKLPAPLQAGQDYELELRAIGPKLTIQYNGTVLGEVEDEALKEGYFGLSNIEEVPVLIKSLDYLDLDARPAARAAAPKTPAEGKTGALDGLVKPSVP
jgi:hypothetical protein